MFRLLMDTVLGLEVAMMDCGTGNHENGSKINPLSKSKDCVDGGGNIKESK